MMTWSSNKFRMGKIGAEGFGPLSHVEFGVFDLPKVSRPNEHFLPLLDAFLVDGGGLL